jgi:hypothetical protein
MNFMKNAISIIFVIFILIAFGILLGCTAPSNNSDANNSDVNTSDANNSKNSDINVIEISDSNSTPQIIGGDRDEHGCLGPAGYSWCEAKQKCLRVWEEDCASISTIDEN